MHFNVTQPRGQRRPMYLEMMDMVARSLRELGHSTTNRYGYDPDLINVAFAYFDATHEFTSRSVFYQLEPICGWRIGVNHFPFDALRANVVWDYSRHNIEVLQTHGVHAHYVPIGHHPALERVPHAAEQDIDVLFYGLNTPRRVAIISALRRAGLNVEYHHRTYGSQLDPFIGRAKVVLNMHGRSDYRTLESLRVGYLMSNRKAVVSEINHRDDDDDLGAGIAGVPFPQLVDTCVDLVRAEDERNRLADKAYATISQRPFNDVLDHVMATVEPLDTFAGAWGPRG
ncbi:CgeB family protein [Nocardia macrotermitis]|uniref:Glycosyltransferase n=1 Tax=Nocardia macrotermitis TaxID=2585198 RepID=A0A7K0DC61_9NOCA|nr:hypothetical protein [Nocardia macrotermitis]MQY22474.1 hypothetical protein [Nocardia macrotermitis]